MSHLYLLELPLDILVNIFKHLNLKDLRNVMLTCKSMRGIILNDNSIWRTVSSGTLVLQDRFYNTNGNRHRLLSWYNKLRISSNWCNGVYRRKVLLMHKTNYMPWLMFYNAEVLLLSIASELHCYPIDRKGIPMCKKHLWNIDVPVVKRYDKRTNDISRFLAKNNFIVCGNRDGCVSLYSYNDITCEPNFIFHIRDCHAKGNSEVTDVELIAKNDTMHLITASESDSKLYFYKLIKDDETGTYENYIQDGIIEDLLPESNGFRCISANHSEDKLAISPYDISKLAVYDIPTMTLVNTASNKDQFIRDIGWHDERTVMLVTHSGRLQLIDTRSFNVVYEACDPFYSTFYCVKSDGCNAIVVGSAEYSRCVLFDSRTSCHHVQMYFTQENASPVYSLDFDATKLIAASDRSLAVLNFNVNVGTTAMRDYSQWCIKNCQDRLS